MNHKKTRKYSGKKHKKFFCISFLRFFTFLSLQNIATILFQTFARSGWLYPCVWSFPPLNWDYCLFKLLDALKKSTVATNNWTPPQKNTVASYWRQPRTAPCDTRPFWHSQTKPEKYTPATTNTQKYFQGSFSTPNMVAQSKNFPPKVAASHKSMIYYHNFHPF